MSKIKTKDIQSCKILGENGTWRIIFDLKDGSIEERCYGSMLDALNVFNSIQKKLAKKVVLSNIIASFIFFLTFWSLYVTAQYYWFPEPESEKSEVGYVNCENKVLEPSKLQYLQCDVEFRLDLYSVHIFPLNYTKTETKTKREKLPRKFIETSFPY